ncbi:primosomal replication protein N [Candidatus Erwinia haradaeae]|uniref:Primosomal replication protein N n=1 Tax=Candidatus Erwinia haradaeae TaxID=1922217 RepID=A0A451D2V0_9GAMM|nr:primosomal replication protein N [Candidatus Erwinia haradaeae]VFP79997.1 Primosomal replication protein N [Candidatus Erwinia haradaeae]
MQVNCSTLSGIVRREPKRVVSPSGILHCQFSIEHRSHNTEAGCNRRVWCLVPVVMSFTVLQEIPEYIQVGSLLKVQGFLCGHKGHNSLYQIVLHAKNIELIKSGEYLNGTLFSSS